MDRDRPIQVQQLIAQVQRHVARPAHREIDARGARNSGAEQRLAAIGLDPVDPARHRHDPLVRDPEHCARSPLPGTAVQPAQHVGVVLPEAFVGPIAELAIGEIVAERGENLGQGSRAADTADVPVLGPLQHVDRHRPEIPEQELA